MKSFNLILTLALVSIVFCTGDVVVASNANPEPSKVMKAYDLSCLQQRIHDNQFMETVYFLPLIVREDNEIQRPDTEAFGAESVLDLLYMVMGKEHFEHNGVHIEIRNNFLIVNAAPDFQKRLASVLAFVTQQLNRSVQIEIELFQMKKVFDFADQQTESLDQALADGNLRKLNRYAVQVRLGEFWETRNGSVMPIIKDYEPEIAQASSVCEPIMEDLFVGLNLALRPMLAPDGRGFILELFASLSRLIEPIDERDLEYEALHTHNEGSDSLTMTRLINDPKLEFASLGSVVSVAPGKPVILSAAFPHHKGLGSLLIVLSARFQPMPDRLDLGEEIICGCLDLGFRQGARKELFSMFLDEGSWRTFETNSNEYDCLHQVPFMYFRSKVLTDDEPILAIFEQYLQPAKDDAAEFYYPFMLGNQILVRTDSLRFEAIRTALANLGKPNPSSGVATVYFYEVKGAADFSEVEEVLKEGKRVGWTSAPISAGGSALSMAGFEGLMVGSYDVDVATHAAVPSINTKDYFDGAVVYLRKERGIIDPGDKGWIEASITLNRLKGPMKSTNLGDTGGILGMIDQPAFDHTVIKARIPCDGALHLLGNQVRKQGEATKTVYAVGQVTAGAN